MHVGVNNQFALSMNVPEYIQVALALCVKKMVSRYVVYTCFKLVQLDKKTVIRRTVQCK